ncbi:MAG: family 16 glycoside hydrolase [bacterium]
MKTIIHLTLFLTLMVCLMATNSITAADKPEENREKGLIAVLQSNASPQEKAITCKRLAIYGTKDAVPALAALLSDEKLASWARIGLEAIPDPAVDDALRDALGKLQGKLLIGVINSIGKRGDAKAVEWISQKLNDSDPALAAASAAALGRIGGEAAAKALVNALCKASPEALPAICEGSLRCADHFILQGKQSMAIKIFNSVLDAKTPRHIRMEAMRGLIVAKQDDGIPLLIEQLKSDDAGMVAVAMGLDHDMPGQKLTKALAAELSKLPPEKQVYMIDALAVRQDKSVVPTLLALTRSSSTNVCIAAIDALTHLVDASSLPQLVEIAVAPDSEIARAAQSAIIGFPSVDADLTGATMLASQNAKVRMIGVNVISRRAVLSAVPAVAKASREDPEAAVRVACIAALRELGGLAEIPGLVDILLKSPSDAETQAAEKALATLCKRQADLGGCTDKLAVGLASAQPAQKCALLRILRSVGEAKALNAIRAAMSDASKEVQDEATRLVCDWSTVEAAPDLLVLARNSSNATYRVLALRGYLRVSGDKNVTDGQRLAMCKDVVTLAQRDDEKKALLSVLASAGDAESLLLAAAYLDQAAIKEEACLAAVAIAERLLKDKPEAVRPVMEKVLKASQDKKLTARAKNVLKEIKPETPAPAAGAGGGVSLFNGKDLTGWDGDASLWSVKDGCITGQTTKENPVKGNTFLIWKGAATDFELTCKVKFTTTAESKFGNSGIQFRSVVLDPAKWVVGGLQADLCAAPPYFGILYDERGAGRSVMSVGLKAVIKDVNGKVRVEATGSVGKKEEIMAAVKYTDWNDYRVFAKGPQIQIWVNGVQTVDATNESTQGPNGTTLALQIHAGPPMMVQFKDIVLKQLK